MELIKEIINKKKNQSLIISGLRVILLKYEVAAQINIYKKLLNPIGTPVTTSFIIPAIKIRPYPK